MKLRVALLFCCLLFRWRVHAAPLAETESLSPKCSQLLQHLLAVITELVKNQKLECPPFDEPLKSLAIQDVVAVAPTTEKAPEITTIADQKEEERLGLAPSLPETTTQTETTTPVVEAETTPVPQAETTTPIAQTETPTPVLEDETTTPVPQDETTPVPQDETTPVPQYDTTPISEISEVEAVARFIEGETTTTSEGETTTTSEGETTTTSEGETITEITTASPIETTTPPESEIELKEEPTTSLPEIETTTAPPPPPITTTTTEKSDVTTEPPPPIAVGSIEGRDALVAPGPYAGPSKICGKPGDCFPVHSLCGNLNDLYVPVFRFDGDPLEAQVQFVFKP